MSNVVSDISDKLFYAKAKKGFIFKVLIDTLLLSINCTERPKFEVTKKGIFQIASDAQKLSDNPDDRISKIMFDIRLYRERFTRYHCSSEFSFSLNFKHLQKILKNIKKKDIVILFIDENDKNKLGIEIIPIGKEKRSQVMHIAINFTEGLNEIDELIPPETYTDDEGEEIDIYDYPVVVDSTDFQKIKQLTRIGDEMIVKIQKDNYISFYTSDGTLYDSEAKVGTIDEDDPDSLIENIYHMCFFSHLVKLPGLCSEMRFFSPPPLRREFPIKIAMDAGNLGEIYIYIKSIRQIQYEKK